MLDEKEQSMMGRGMGRVTRENILGDVLETGCVGESLLKAEQMSAMKKMVGGSTRLKCWDGKW